MDLPFFLYRRLARWVTCEVRVPGGRLRLSSKYEVASFQDVFCEPFYWQLFSCLRTPPRLIIDCGAHCGHFSALAEACVRARFGTSSAQYVLVEPNPHLHSSIARTLSDMQLQERSEVLRGVVGSTQPAQLWVHPRNYLDASLTRPPNGATKPIPVEAIDLARRFPTEHVDVLKLDIEGGEFGFVAQSADLLRRTELVFMEIHGRHSQAVEQLLQRMRETGHCAFGDVLPWNGNQLALFRNAGVR